MRIALHFIGYGSVATDIVTSIADQEHGFRFQVGDSEIWTQLHLYSETFSCELSITD